MHTFTLPSTTPRPFDPLFDTAGNLWTTVAGAAIAKVDPATRRITATYALGIAGRSFRAIVLGPDGAFWGTSGTASNGTTGANESTLLEHPLVDHDVRNGRRQRQLVVRQLPGRPTRSHRPRDESRRSSCRTRRELQRDHHLRHDAGDGRIHEQLALRFHDQHLAAPLDHGMVTSRPRRVRLASPSSSRRSAKEARPAEYTASIPSRGTGPVHYRGKTGCARSQGIGWSRGLRRPQPEMLAIPWHRRGRAVVPVIHALTASTTFFLYTKDRTATVLETVDQ